MRTRACRGWIATIAAAAVVSVTACSSPRPVDLQGGRPAASPTSAVLLPSKVGPPREVALRWVPANMADEHRYDRAEAVALARSADLVAGIPTSFRGLVPAMRRANPDIVVLTYVNGMFTTPDRASGLPAEWFAAGPSGERVRSREFSNFLMDPGSPEWRRHIVDECVRRSADVGSDGCLVDTLGLGVLNDGYVTSRPQRRSTGRPWSHAQWAAELEQVARAFARLPLVVVGNSVSSADRYWETSAPSRDVSLALPGVQFEDFLRGANDSASRFPDHEQWLKAVRVIQDLEDRDRRVLVTTKLWAPANAGVRDQWQRFSMASFLLAADGLSYYAFTAERSRRGAAGAVSTYTLPRMGHALAGMRRVDGTYRRDFSGGTVLVNPHDQPSRVALDRPLMTLEGQRVTSVVLPPKDGAVLTLPDGRA